MSFQNKGFWMAKGGGHLTDGDTASDSSSRIEPKRSHQWFTDAAEPEPFPNKKQALQVPNSKPTAGILNANAPNWENSSSLQSIPNQFIDRLFGTETIRTVNFAERNIGPVGTDNSNMRNKGISGQFGNDSPVGFPISPTLEDPDTCLSYGGIRKVKVNLVKDSDNGLYEPKENNSGNEISYIPMGQAYNKEDESEMVMGLSYNRSMVSTSEEGSYNKGETTAIPFSGFHTESNINLLAQPISSYELFYDQSSVQTPESPSKTELDASNADTVIISSRVAKPRPEFAPKNKPEVKVARKVAPNSFPSNVKSLLSTGMLDGVPVKYVSVSREVLRGVIKGTGYLCACQSCNYSKVLNAYEFESHAGPKTKHPNNHIHFENGKTIYQIVQELRSTPESLLFDALQTVTGSPINQKSFRVWKESFQAATRELQRIYGKEELNL